MIDHAKPPFPKQKQPMPGFTAKMNPVPDHGETSYKGAGRGAPKYNRNRDWDWSDRANDRRVYDYYGTPIWY